MQTYIKNIFFDLGFSEGESFDLSNQIIILSLKEGLSELLSDEDFQQFDKNIEAKEYNLLVGYIEKINKSDFENIFSKRVVENIKIALDSIYNELPQDLKTDFVQAVKEIQSKNFAEVLKTKEGKIEDVLKSLVN